MSEVREKTVEERIESGRHPDVPKLYFNGFVNAFSTSDVMTVLERNGQAVATLNMSFTVAKTFAQALNQMIAQLETQAGRPMLTTHEFAQVMNNPPVKN